MHYPFSCIRGWKEQQFQSSSATGFVILLSEKITKLKSLLKCRWFDNCLLLHSLNTSLTFISHRATWIQTELFLSFPPPAIASITLFPLNAEDTAGRFRVWLTSGDEQKLVWDRKTEGGFPELKVLVRVCKSSYCIH